MNTFIDPERILVAVGAPPVPDSEALVEAILNDALVCKRAMALAIDAFKLQAVVEMGKAEKHALLTRLRVPGVLGQPQSGKISWAVAQAPSSGQWHISCSCDHGAGMVARAFFTGDPAHAAKWAPYGTVCPPQILAEYKANWKPLTVRQ